MSTRDPAAAPMRWATVPNAVSLARLVVFIPLTVWLITRPGMEWWAALSLALFGGTDWIDGQLARRLDQVSRVGEVLDPIADRVGVIAISITMVVCGYLPTVVVVAVVVADAALLVVGLLRVDRVREGHVMFIGKVRTALMMVSLPLLLVASAPGVSDHGWVRTGAVALVTVATVMHVLVAVLYIVRLLRRVPEEPLSP